MLNINFINAEKYLRALDSVGYQFRLDAMVIEGIMGYNMICIDNSDDEDIYDIFITEDGIYNVDHNGQEDSIGALVTTIERRLTADWIVWHKIQSDIKKGTKTLLEEAFGSEIYNMWIDPSRNMFGFSVKQDEDPDKDIFGFFGTVLSLNEWISDEAYYILKEVFYGAYSIKGDYCYKFRELNEIPYDRWDDESHCHIHATGYEVATTSIPEEYFIEYESGETWCNCFTMDMTDVEY